MEEKQMGVVSGSVDSRYDFDENEFDVAIELFSESEYFKEIFAKT